LGESGPTEEKRKEGKDLNKEKKNENVELTKGGDKKEIFCINS